MERRILYLSMLLLLLASGISAAQENGYKITYTIYIDNDGTAKWNVEYRTPLVSKVDFDAFENYTSQLKSVYLKEFKGLMEKSVSDAANVTSRKMIAGGFIGEAKVETAPTGTYGVVHYSFIWTNFAQKDSIGNINVGDVFVGGLYLSKDNTLIIQYPSGYTVENVSPNPDQVRDGLIWYGLRSFDSGEPGVSLLHNSITWTTYAIIASGLIIVAAGAFIYLRKTHREKNIEESPEPASETITGADLMDLEEKILKLLKDSGGSMHQSDIGKSLVLPKSTISSALNELHNKNMIQKIKKGRENLIRLV